MKRIGILELLTSKVTTTQEAIASFFFKKQYISVTPQAISVWCRQMGHRVHYATYYGMGDPHKKLPADLDIVFISAPRIWPSSPMPWPNSIAKQGYAP